MPDEPTVPDAARLRSIADHVTIQAEDLARRADAAGPLATVYRQDAADLAADAADLVALATHLDLRATRAARRRGVRHARLHHQPAAR